MSWAERAGNINIDDTVAISYHTGELPRARGLVTELTTLRAEIVLADIDWDREGLPERLDVKNSSRVTQRGILE